MIFAEVMTEAVRTCAPGDTLQHAAQIMWDQDCGSVPVVRDDGHVLGMITDRDICMAAFLRQRRLDECLVRDAMNGPAVACRPSDPIEKAEAAMREHRIRRVPVIDAGDRVTGILSLNDIVLATPQASEGHGSRPGKQVDVRPEQVLTTFATICQHRN
jgi:CBS domain-containing protein